MNSSALYCGSGGGGAALRAAAGAGDAAACARLLGAVGNASVRFSRDELGRSALHLASSAGHAHVVRLLLNAAAHREVDSPDGAGCTPLQRAAADGHEDVIKLLLARGADVDKQDSVHGNSALHEASWKGYSRSVKILVLAGANLSKSNAGGFTALHLSCQNGHNQSCRELLLGGCDPDLQNNYGDTALHTAARYGHAGVTRILLSAQAKVAEQNKNGDTALHISSAMGRRKLTRILLENNCPKSIRNKQNETPEDIARRKDLREILTILTEVNGILGGRGEAATSTSRSRELNKKSCCNKKDKERKRSKSKVRFENNNKNSNKDSVDGAGANKADGKNYNWSPYGCHYYPDPEAFPQPRLDSLPTEPLKKGEQYYSDLAGNIKKGPVGLGYTCYCAPLFRHLEARLEKDKRELQKAQVKLGQRLAGLEQRIGGRNAYGRRSERVISHTHNKDNNNSNMNSLSRSKSLEMLDANIGFNMSEIKVNGNTMMIMNKMGKATKKTKSMDELKDDLDGDDDNGNGNGNGSMPRRSVKEIVALLQAKGIKHNDSESSDEEDGPLIMAQHRGPMEDSNLIDAASGFEETGVIAPRSRIAMYSPTGLINTNQRFDGDAFRATSVSPLRDSCSASPRDSGILSREPPMSPPQTESPKSSQKSPPMITPSDWQKLHQDFNFNANHAKNENRQQIKSPIAMATTSTTGTGTGTSGHHLNYFQYPDQAHFPHSSSQSIRQQQNNNNAIMYERNYADNMNARFAKLRMLDSTVKLMAENPSSSSYSLSPLPLQQSTSRMLDSKKMFDSTSRMLENVQHTILERDRDTNNDSGYSTKVYGSSKGNSPSLSGQIDNNNELILNNAVSSSSSPSGVVTAAVFATTTMTTTKNTGNGAPGLSASSLV